MAGVLAAIRLGSVVIGLLKDLFAEQITTGSLAGDLRRHDADLTAEDAELLAEVLVPFIRSVPDALAWAITLSKDKRCGRAVAFGTGQVLQYLFDDEDLLPESSFGAIGLIDDALLVHLFVRQLREAFPFTSPATGYHPPERGVIDVAASLLPEGVATALLRTGVSLVQTATALFGTTGELADVDGAITPVLRSGAAVRACRSSRAAVAGN